MNRRFMKKRNKKPDPYAREYGPTARKHSSAMSRYYAAVHRAIKRAFSGRRKRTAVHGRTR